MRVGMIAFVFSLTTVYVGWRTLQMKQGKPTWPGDRYLKLIGVSILAIGCILVAVYHL